jgi:uncharacterized protein DUF3347
MKKQALILTIGISLLTYGLEAQNHDHNKMDMDNHEGMIMSYDAPESFQAQLHSVYLEIIKLNDVFVSSNAAKVNKIVIQVEEKISKVDMQLLKGEAHMFWMGNLQAFNKDLKSMKETENLNDQRKLFASLNSTLYKSIKAFGINGEEAYYQYCPMANGNEGAYWLSDSRKIRNPYLGSAMLTCGSTQEVLK